MYHSWAAVLPANVEVCALRLPGRESRFDEPRLTSVETMVKAMADAMTLYLDRPFALFGYSLGALLFFELTRELRRRGANLPVHLFLAAARAPHMARVHPPLTYLPDKEFLAAIRHYYHPASEAWAVSELVEMMLPILRDDMRASETYEFTDEVLLSCSMDLYAGYNDLGAPLDKVRAWQTLTTAECQMTVYSGTHFFIDQHLPELLQAVRERLLALTGESAVGIQRGV